MVSRLTVGDFAFYAAGAFLFGILAASLAWNIVIVIVMVATSAAVILTFCRMSGRWKLAVFFIDGVFAGMFYYHAYVDLAASRVNLPIGKTVSFSAIVTDEPKLSERFDLLTARAEPPFSGTFSIFADPGSDFHYGDEVRVTGTVSPPRQAGDDPAIFPKNIEFISAGHGFWLRAVLISFKSDIAEKFDAVLPADEASLLGGITIGGTDGMAADLKNEMALSGTSYVATMYGYKISVIVFIVVELFGGFVARRIRVCCAIALIILFVMMVGLEPSALRAGIMACMALVAREIGRTRGMRNAITLTAAAMSLWDPTLLVQASFALSFLSLLGIAYVGPALKRAFGWDGPRTKEDTWGWRSAVIVPTASLLAILPVALSAFGRFSLSAFASNILIFPTIPPTIFLGCMIAFLACFSLLAAFFVAKVASAALWYQLGIIKLFSIATIPIPPMLGSFWPAALYYAALALFIYRYSQP